MLKSVNIPTANLGGFEDTLNDLLNGSPSFEVVQVHDNLIICEDGAPAGHTSYQVVVIPSSMNASEVDDLLNEPLGASPDPVLFAVHPNFAIFATL